MNKFSLYTKTFQSNDWYEVFTYPAGEMQVRVTAPQLLNEPLNVRDTMPVTIVARLYNPADLIELALLVNALEGLGVVEITLVIPYLPFSRADRRFVRGDCKGVGFITNFLKPMGGVLTLDVHSNRAVNWAITNVDPIIYIRAAIEHTSIRAECNAVSVLYPDKGAAERYVLPEHIGSNWSAVDVQCFYATKQRDPVTGALIGFSVPEMPKDLPVLIVDDICDGGGTFIGIAKSLKEQGLDYSLYTTHSMYSKGTDVLYDAGFDYLYTTNSFYRDTADTPDKMVVYDCVGYLVNKAKQLNGEI